MTNTRPGLHRRWIALTFAIAAMLVYAAAWMTTATLVRGEIDHWIARRREQGFSISVGQIATSGFPGRIAITLPDIEVTAAEGSWRWQTALVRVGTWPLVWRRIALDLGRDHSLAGLVTPLDIPLWLSAGRAEGEARLNGAGRVVGVDLRAENLRIALTQGGEALVRFGHGHAAFDLNSAPPQPTAATLPPTARMVLEAEDVSLPPDLGLPIQTPVHRAALTVEFTGALPAGPLTQSLEFWRAGHGTLEIRSAELDWPPVRINASATIALDDRLQPLGAASLRIQGSNAVLDALVKTGQMGEGEAGLARVGLAMMSRAGNDGASEMGVSLTLQDQRLTAGPLTLMELPTLQWPAVTVP